MASSFLGCLSLGTLLVATSYAVPIAPGASLAARGRCRDENGFIVGTRVDCSQLVPAVTLPPADYVWRRDETGPEDVGLKADGITGDEALVYPRDEFTHEKTSSIFIKVPAEKADDAGSASGNLPTVPATEKASSPGQGQPWLVTPESNTIGVPKITLPIKKPVPMARRTTNTEHAIRADIVTHEPADEIWRRDDKVWEADELQYREQTKPQSDTSTPASDKSEAEQLFEQSRSADKGINLNEAKLTIMRLADDIYRRRVPDTKSPGGGRLRVPVDNQPPSSYQAPGGVNAGPVKTGKLVILDPAGSLYRRSQNIETAGQNIESASQNGVENVATIKDLYETLTALNGKSQRKARNAVLESEAKFADKLYSIYQRDPGVSTVIKDIKDQVDKFKPRPGSDSSSGNPGKDGDSASGSDPARSRPGQSDSKSSSKKRSEPDTGMSARSPTLRDILGSHDVGPIAAAPAAAHPPAGEVYRRNLQVERSVLGHHQTDVQAQPEDGKGLVSNVMQRQEKKEGHFEAVEHGLDSIVFRHNTHAGVSEEETDKVKRFVPPSDLEMPELEDSALPVSNASNHNSPEQQAYDDALAGMRDAITQFIELCKNPVVLEHLKTDSIEKCQSKVRKALKHVNSKDSTKSPPTNSQVESVLNTILARGTTDAEKEQKDKDREAQVSLRAWQKYQDTCGGLLAFACEPKCTPSDPWPCIPQPAWAHQPATRVEKRGHEATPAPKVDSPKTAPATGEVPGSPKHVVLGRLKAVYRRDAPVIDSVLPGFPTPNAHKTADRVFRREEIFMNPRPNGEEPQAGAAAPWYHRKAASVVGFPNNQLEENNDNDIAARKVKPSPSPRPKPTPTPVVEAEPKPLLPGPTPIDYNRDSDPPKYAVKVPADSVYKPVDVDGDEAQKRSTGAEDADLSSTIEGSKLEGMKENIEKRDDEYSVLGSSIKVTGNLPVVHGLAADVHRRNVPPTTETREDEGMRKRCYGQFPGADLCVLDRAPEVYVSKFDGDGKETKDKSEEKGKGEDKDKKENDKRKTRHDPTQTPSTNDTPGTKAKRIVCNPDLSACAHEPIDSVYGESIGETGRRDDANVSNSANPRLGDVAVGSAGDEKESKGDEKEKKKAAKEEEKARKKAEKESEKNGDSAQRRVMRMFSS